MTTLNMPMTSSPLSGAMKTASATMHVGAPPKKSVERKPDLTYYITPPESKWATLIWRWRIRFEATFGITVLEPWEKVVVVTFLALVFALITYGIVKFVPAQLLTMQRRATYYIWGHDSDMQRFWAVVSSSKDGGN